MHGHRIVLRLFSKIVSDELRGFIIWLPMVKGDSASSAAALLSADKRFLIQAWDPKGTAGQAFSRTLNLPCPAWDVYLLYDRGIQWTDKDPPAPSLWMHQLSEHKVDQSLRLKESALLHAVSQRIKE